MKGSADSNGLSGPKLEESGDKKFRLPNINMQTAKPPEESLHDIHDFEVDIDVELNNNNNSNGGKVDGHNSSMNRSASASLMSNQNQSSTASSSGAPQRHGEKPKHRFLDLQEYKRRRGLI